MDKSTIEVGDRVKIVDKGAHYPSFNEWLRGNAPHLLDLWIKADRDSLEENIGDNYIVLHKAYDDMLM